MLVHWDDEIRFPVRNTIPSSRRYSVERLAAGPGRGLRSCVKPLHDDMSKLPGSQPKDVALRRVMDAQRIITWPVSPMADVDVTGGESPVSKAISLQCWVASAVVSSMQCDLMGQAQEGHFRSSSRHW